MQTKKKVDNCLRWMNIVAKPHIRLINAGEEEDNIHWRLQIRFCLMYYMCRGNYIFFYHLYKYLKFF